MAYKQTPGRGNNKKTGYGIPQVFDQSPMLQAKNKKTSVPKSEQTKENYNISQALEDKINETSAENKKRVLVEAQAKSDSTSAYNTRGGNEYQNIMAGNRAANATRSKAGYGDMNVMKGKEISASGPNKITYMRGNKVEKNMPTGTYNKKSGLYDPNPNESLFEKAKSWITTRFTSAD
jgi:hypothetical protein